MRRWNLAVPPTLPASLSRAAEVRKLTPRRSDLHGHELGVEDQVPSRAFSCFLSLALLALAAKRGRKQEDASVRWHQ